MIESSEEEETEYTAKDAEMITSATASPITTTLLYLSMIVVMRTK
jgi:hypothetical protein